MDPTVKIVGHPPNNPAKRAFVPCDESRTPKDYLTRNHEIVRETELLLAFPKGKEQLRSGTWATVRLARKQKRTVVVFGPDGTRS
jgi:hypothetical protein